MKKYVAVILFICGPLFSATAQHAAPGVFYSKADSTTIEGVFYRKDARFLPREKKDSVTIHKIVARRVFNDVGTFVLSNGGNYYPIDTNARMFIAAGYKPIDDAIASLHRKPVKLHLSATNPVMTVVASGGYQITTGQKIRFGKGTNPDSSFRYVRYHSTSAFLLYSEETEKNALNSFTPGDRSLAGQEMKVDHIAFTRGRKKAPAEYWLLNFPGRRMFQIEIELEPALQSGELELPEEFRKREGAAEKHF